MERILNKIKSIFDPINKKLPSLSHHTKEFLVRSWPILAIIFGVIQILEAWDLYLVARAVDSLVNYTCPTSSLCPAIGSVTSLNIFYWVGLVVLVLDGLILLQAYNFLRVRDIKGWYLIFIAALINVVYGLLEMFGSNTAGVSKFVFSVIESGVVIYFLMQIYSFYSPKNPK